MTSIHRTLAVSALVLSAASHSGCVLGTREPTLYYPPKAEADAVPAAQAAAKPVTKTVHVVLVPFADQRSDKKVVGTTRNAYGMKMADVIPKNSVPDWVTQALKTELQNDGYVVQGRTPGDEGPASRSAIISGEVLNVFCDMYLEYTGQVSLLVRVKRDGKELLNKHYAGEGSAGLAWAATEESYAQSLALALSSAIQKFVRDLDQSLMAP